eukprot:COSAG03_NODE_14746_length_453_cov_1.443503_1_plen_26_part_10
MASRGQVCGSQPAGANLQGITENYAG